MKRTDPVALGEILDLYINTDGNRAEFNRRKVEYCWAEVVGPEINRATTSRYVQGSTLHVNLSSAPLKSELSFMTAPLIKALNDAVGDNVIDKIVFH